MKAVPSISPVARQISRYGLVGVLSNVIGYLVYLALTFLGLDPKIAISILYPVGVMAAYFGHLKYSFSFQGKITSALPRYCLAHLVGYGINFLMLLMLADKLGLPHQAVQALAILVVAGILFLMFKYYVFPRS